MLNLSLFLFRHLIVHFHLLWSDCLCHFYVFRVAFSTIVVSLSSPVYVIVILCFCAFWTNKDT